MTFLMILSVYLLSNSIVYSAVQTKKCEEIGRGSICDDQLLGYFDCDGSSPDGVYHKCNTGYMCSCGINIRCDTTKPKCIKRPTIPDVPKDFIVSFTGQLNISFPTGSRSEQLKGIFYQDNTGKMILKRTDYRTNEGKLIRKISELTRKVSGHPNFVKYTLTQFKDGTFHCFATKVESFTDLFHDLQTLSYQASKDVFVYRDGPIHGGDNAVTQRWEYTNLNGLQYSPRFYTYVDSGSVASKVFTSLKIRYNYFHLLRPHPETFRVPYQCAKTVVH